MTKINEFTFARMTEKMAYVGNLRQRRGRQGIQHPNNKKNTNGTVALFFLVSFSPYSWSTYLFYHFPSIASQNYLVFLTIYLRRFHHEDRFYEVVLRARCILSFFFKSLCAQKKIT